MTDVFTWQSCRRCGSKLPPSMMVHATDGPVCGACQAIAMTAMPEAMAADLRSKFYSAKLDYETYCQSKGLNPCLQGKSPMDSQNSND